MSSGGSDDKVVDFDAFKKRREVENGSHLKPGCVFTLTEDVLGRLTSGETFQSELDRLLADVNDLNLQRLGAVLRRFPLTEEMVEAERLKYPSVDTPNSMWKWVDTTARDARPVSCRPSLYWSFFLRALETPRPMPK